MDSGDVKMRTVMGVGVGERVTIGKLREVGEGDLANGSEIALCRKPIDAKRLLEISRADFSALVCVGEGKGEIAETAREVGLPTLFLSEDAAEECDCGENAILYPDRGMLFVSPTIAVMDEFTSISERLPESRELSGIKVCDICEYLSGKILGKAVEMSEQSGSEDALFEIYSRFAEECGEGYITVLIQKEVNRLEHLRALLRAAVYGRIAVASFASSVREYREFCEVFDMAREELSRERREFEDGIARGVASGDILSLLYASELARASDFFVVDAEHLTQAAVGEEKDEACGRYLRLLADEASANIDKLLVCGERELIKTAVEKSKTNFP